MIWFNPHFNANVNTNFGKLLKRLIDKPFPRHHKFQKLSNRNNVELSYSCMPNMKSVIQEHNSKIMRIRNQPTTKLVVVDKNQISF